MNTTPTDEAVLKQDVLGRVKTPKARREQLLDEFERSGLPGLKFAEAQPGRWLKWSPLYRRRGKVCLNRLNGLIARSAMPMPESMMPTPSCFGERHRDGILLVRRSGPEATPVPTANPLYSALSNYGLSGTWAGAYPYRAGCFK
jgi:hypothetical protein